jgi:hypothetical protein
MTAGGATAKVRRLLGRVKRALWRPAPPAPLPDPVAPESTRQVLLRMLYKALLASGATPPRLDEVGFTAYSQTDEDGILLYIFSVIGAPHRTAVEICAGDGVECNTANLLVHHGWTGLLVDGDAALVERGRAFYRADPRTRIDPPAFVHAWVTRDNVNRIVRDAGFGGEIDLLSIDVDGMDYWLWEALDVVEPRVVVVEYQDILGPHDALTVPYQDDFNAYDHPTTDGMPNYCGASLPAFVQLARTRGYRLVGCNRYGYNAFFVREPLGREALPEIAVEECFRHPRVRRGMRERLPTVRDLPWVAV